MPFAIVPIRSFRLGKQRLAPHLTDPERRFLAAVLAERVTHAATAAGLSPLVVTADPEVASWSEQRDFEVVTDPGRGLDDACDAGVAAADERWVVIHSDLPLVGAEDMAVVAGLLDTGRDVIAPSSDGGTSVLSSTDSVRFSYGPGSFHRHLAQLPDPVVLARTGFLHDLDTPRDFESASRLGALE